jgi:hypothetical protein
LDGAARSAFGLSFVSEGADCLDFGAVADGFCGSDWREAC